MKLIRQQAMYKNNPRTHSTLQNKKAVLTAATYFKVSTSLMSQRQKNVVYITSKTAKPEWRNPEAAVRKCSAIWVFLKSHTKFTAKHLWWSLLLIQLLAANLQPVTLFKKRLQQRCFPVNFWKIFTTAFL